jgi:hypothetical protein
MVGHDITFAIRFPDLELGEAGQLAQDLREQLLDDVPHLDVELRKEDPATQDVGAILVGVLGAPSVVLLARGVAVWLMRRGKSLEIEVDGSKLTFRAQGSIDDNAVKIAEVLSRKRS